MALDVTKFSQEQIAELLKQLAASRPDALAQAIKEDSDVMRVAKTSMPVGEKRAPSFLQPVIEAVIAALVSSLECTDLAGLDSRIREGDGQQVAATATYKSADGAEHRVRFTILSEDAAFCGVVAKAREAISAAKPADLEKIATKMRASIKRGRVDGKARETALSEFDAAVKARGGGATGAVGATVAPPPPVPEDDGVPA